MVEHWRNVSAAAESLNPAQEPLRSFLAAMIRANDCMILFEAQGRILDLSLEIAELLGDSVEALAGSHLARHLTTSTLSFKALLFQLRQAENTETKVVRWRTAIVRPDGETRHLELSISRPQGMDPPIFLALVSDITLAYRLEQQLDYRDATYQALYRKAPVMLHSIDTRGRLISVSERWLEVLGYEEDEVLGRPSIDFLTPASRRLAIERVLPLYRREGKVDNIPYQFVRKDGQIVDVLLSAISETNPQGKPQRSMAVLIDVTKLNQTEQERRNLEKQVFRLQKLESLEVMAGGAAHDFNNILTVILSNLTLAEGESLHDEALSERLQNIEHAALRAADICSQMLAYSGRGQRRKEGMNLTRMVHEMASMLEVSIQRKAELHLDLQEKSVGIQGDPTQIRQVLMNLLLNAADAVHGPGGRIEVRTGSLWCDTDELPHFGDGEPLSAGRFSYIEVEDNGCGMDAVTLNRLFDPFYTTKAEGRGLGMAVVFGHVRGHRGTIDIESTPGRGTRIRVLLPSTEASASSSEESRQSRPKRAPSVEDSWV